MLRAAHGQSCVVKQLHHHAVGLAIPGGPAHREALAPGQQLEVPDLGVCRQGGELVDRPCGDDPLICDKALHTNLLGLFPELTQDPGDDKTVIAQGTDHRRLGVQAIHARGQQGQSVRDYAGRVHIAQEGLTRALQVDTVRLVDQNECAIGAQGRNAGDVLAMVGDGVWLNEQRSLLKGDTILIKTLGDQAPVSCISRPPHHHKVAFATQCSNLGLLLSASGL